MGVAAVVDGIQQTKTLTHRAGRPVVLAFLAAGAVDPATGTLLAIEERLTLHCATQDVGWLADVTNSTVPIEHTPATHFREVEDDIAAAIGDKRMRLEARLVRRLLTDAPDTQHVVVDGSLAPHARDRRVVGLVKTTDTTYLACEHQLLSLPEGRTTPAFRTDHAHSSYLRLHHNHRRSWAHGLVRLETHDPSLLDQFASWAMSQRQPPTTKDPRGDRHLSPVAVCEAWLRSRTPAVLTLDLDQ
ncbi:hypothetical protein [Euzebya pacifica]|uniref:hypothetical protein n=1 Tax=Euzebya pacifica TaxID=1608957 RepID=UPI0030F8326A